MYFKATGAVWKGGPEHTLRGCGRGEIGGEWSEQDGILLLCFKSVSGPELELELQGPDMAALEAVLEAIGNERAASALRLARGEGT